MILINDEDHIGMSSLAVALLCLLPQKDSTAGPMPFLMGATHEKEVRAWGKRHYAQCVFLKIDASTWALIGISSPGTLITNVYLYRKFDTFYRLRSVYLDRLGEPSFKASKHEIRISYSSDRNVDVFRP